MQFAGAGIASALPISLQAAGGTFDTNGNNAVLSGTISGPGSLTKIGIGTLTLSGSGSYGGGTFVNVGTLQAGAANAFSPSSAFRVAAGAFLDLDGFSQTVGSLAGSGNVTLAAATLTTGNDGASTSFLGAISGSGGLIKIGGGTFTLAGASAYTGATAVNAGILQIDGSIATSSLTSVNNGGTLTGSGTVGATRINSGGTFAPGSASPGSAMTVAGNLAFQSGALYLVQVNPATSTFAIVSGNAALAGTVGVKLAAGSYIAKQYDILHSAGLGNTRFSGLVVADLPTSFAAGLIYTPTDVLLNLTASLGGGGGLNGNQQNAASAINNAFNNGATLPPGFLTVFGLGGGALANALAQSDGEAATDAGKGAFKLMDQFLALTLDQTADVRSGSGWPSGGGAARGFAPDRQAGFPPDAALAYGSVLKAPPRPAAFDQRWSAWGAGFGGNNKTNGDPLVGTSTVAARDYGFAGGLDYRLSPDSVVGFALAGGGTNWGLAQGLGGGRSDAFQAAVYGSTRSGPAYVAAALAFATHWMTIERVAFGGDQLAANFNGQSYAGRLEAGYRYAAALRIVATPYAAMQVQSFSTPAYRETDLTGGGFGVSYNAMTAADTRSEIGARFDYLTLLGAMPLTLRARAAWAHDWVTSPSLSAVFQSLPGGSFIVNGAAPPKDSALASAGAELYLTRALSLAVKFDGECAAGSQTWAGTGTLRYSW
jgi:autotransporter-associated beta strand protein